MCLMLINISMLKQFHSGCIISVSILRGFIVTRGIVEGLAVVLKFRATAHGILHRNLATKFYGQFARRIGCRASGSASWYPREKSLRRCLRPFHSALNAFSAADNVDANRVRCRHRENSTCCFENFYRCNRLSREEMTKKRRQKHGKKRRPYHVEYLVCSTMFF